jgi:hypothetical protein
MRRALLLGLAITSIAAEPALAVLDSPPRANWSTAIQTIYGTCVLQATTETAPAPGTSQVTASEFADCGALSVTPRSIWLTSVITGPGTTDQANGPASGERLCSFQRSCSLRRSLTLLPPGDYTARHRIAVDLTTGAGSDRYHLSHPPDCRVSASDSGYLVCDITHTVTHRPTPPAPPSLPALPALPTP